MAIKPDPAPTAKSLPMPSPDNAPPRSPAQLARARRQLVYRAIQRNKLGKGGAATTARLKTAGVLLNPPKQRAINGIQRFPSSNGRYVAGGNGGAKAPRPDAAPKRPRAQRFPSTNGRYAA